MSDAFERALLEALAVFPAVTGYLIAYSGGPDSSALLHGLARHRNQLAPMRAVHVHHGLHAEADEWAAFCEARARALQVEFEVLRVDARDSLGVGLEARARELRYRALKLRLRDEEMLLTAHHRDDQAETLLLQLFRGAGPHGLASMATVKPWANGFFGRPLLGCSQREVADYVAREEIATLQDPSNEDIGRDRNLLRNEILPRLHQRWPSLSKTLTRAADLQAATARLLDASADLELETLLDRDAGTLDCAGVLELASDQRNNVVRRWIRVAGAQVPSAAKLNQICRHMLQARADSNAVVAWGETEVRHYRRRLYLVGALPPIEATFTARWDPSTSLALPGGVLSSCRTLGAGLADNRTAGLQVRFRRGGERLRLGNNRPRRALTKLFQETGVPPWVRVRTPLLFVGEDLVAVPGVGVAVEYAARAGETGWKLNWIPAMRHRRKHG